MWARLSVVGLPMSLVKGPTNYLNWTKYRRALRVQTPDVWTTSAIWALQQRCLAAIAPKSPSLVTGQLITIIGQQESLHSVTTEKM